MLDRPIFPLSQTALTNLWQRTVLVAGARKHPRLYSVRVGRAAELDGKDENFPARALTPEENPLSDPFALTSTGTLTPALRNYIMSQTSDVFESSYQTERVRENLLYIGFEGVTDSENPLFKVLRNLTLTSDPDAPIYPTPEQIDMIEGRRDISQLRTEGARNKLQRRRKDLWALAVEECRKAYFAEADSLRRRGLPTTHLRSGAGPPQKTRYRHAGLDLSPLLPQIADCRPGYDSIAEERSSAALSWLVGYLRWDWVVASGPPTPTGPTCLCCGRVFARTWGVTRHCKDVHVAAGLFDKPYQCPGCPDKPPVRGPSEWSNHVAMFHGARHAPNFPSARPLNLKPLN